MIQIRVIQWNGKQLRTLTQLQAFLETQRFVHWYNVDHRHSGIRYVSPAQRHAGEDIEILARRHAVYQRAKTDNPSRWSRDTRNWSPIRTVALNPTTDTVVSMAKTDLDKRSIHA